MFGLCIPTQSSPCVSFRSEVNNNNVYIDDQGGKIIHEGRGKSSGVNLMIHDRLSKGITKSASIIYKGSAAIDRQETIKFCLREFCLINEMLKARGDVDEAKDNMKNFIKCINNSTYDDLRNEAFNTSDGQNKEINNLIAIFSNKKDSYWNVKVNRGSAKYAFAVKELLNELARLNTELLTETLLKYGLDLKEITNNIDKFLDNADPKYTQNVGIKYTDSNEFIVCLGARNGTMGTYSEINYGNVYRDATPLERKFSSANKVIKSFNSKSRNVNLSTELDMFNTLSLKTNVDKSPLKRTLSNPDISTYGENTHRTLHKRADSDSNIYQPNKIEQAQEKDRHTARIEILESLNETLENRNLTIKELNLSHNNLTSTELTHIFNNCKVKIEYLDLSYNPSLTALTAKHFFPKSLKKINLTGTGLSEKSPVVIQLKQEGVTVIINSGNLDLTGKFKNLTGRARMIQYLSLTHNLKGNKYDTVNLSDNNLQLNELQDICSLNNIAGIKKLILNDNKALNKLTKELLNIKELKHLDLSGTDIGSLIGEGITQYKNYAAMLDKETIDILGKMQKEGIIITYAKNCHIGGRPSSSDYPYDADLELSPRSNSIATIDDNDSNSLNYELWTATNPDQPPHVPNYNNYII